MNTKCKRSGFFMALALVSLWSCGKGTLKSSDRLSKLQPSSNTGENNVETTNQVNQTEKLSQIVTASPMPSPAASQIDVVQIAKAPPVQISIPLECCNFQSQDVFIRKCLAFDINACDTMNR